MFLRSYKCKKTAGASLRQGKVIWVLKRGAVIGSITSLFGILENE
jgi:hypothetical protein